MGEGWAGRTLPQARLHSDTPVGPLHDCHQPTWPLWMDDNKIILAAVPFLTTHSPQAQAADYQHNLTAIEILPPLKLYSVKLQTWCLSFHRNRNYGGYTCQTTPRYNLGFSVESQTVLMRINVYQSTPNKGARHGTSYERCDA